MISSVNGTSFADYLAAIRNGNTQHASVAFPDQSVSLDESNISEGGLEYRILLNSQDDIQLGLTPCATIKMNLLNYDGSLSGIDFTDEFTVGLGVEVNGTNIEQQIGVFIGNKPQKVNQKIIELTGYDRMILFNQPAEGFVTAEGTQTKTALQYFYDLCTYVGVPYKVPTNAINTSRTFPYMPTSGIGRTCREILGYLAEFMGCYVRIAMDGEAELVSFASTGVTIPRNDQMIEPDIAEYTVPTIDKVQVKVTDADIGVIVGSGNTCYSVVDNPFFYGNTAADVQPYAQNLLTRLNGLFSAPYTPVSVQVDGTWLLETGDIISLTLEDGSTLAMPIFNIDLLWNGNANIVYECTGNEAREEMNETNRETYREGYKYHELVKDIDSLVSEIGDRSGKTTTIAQDIEHVELLASQVSHIWVMLTDPSLTEDVQEGDLWVKREFESWQDVLDDVSSWSALNNGDRLWASLVNEEVYTWKDHRWVRITLNKETLSNIEELRKKYDIVSGIDIEADGITIDGSKYIRMRSGSGIEVEAGADIDIAAGGGFSLHTANFTIDSSSKTIDIGSGAEVSVENGGTVDVGNGGSTVIESGGALEVKSGGDMTVESGGDLTIESGGGFKLQTANFTIDSSAKSIGIGNGSAVNVGSGGVVDIGNGGKTTIESGGDLEVKSGGDLNIEAGGGFNLQTANFTINSSTKQLGIGDGADINVGSNGDVNINNNGKINVGNGGKTVIQTGGILEVQSGGDMNIKSGGDLNIEAGGNLNVQSTNFILDSVNKTIDIKATNFTIDSENKKVQAGDFIIDDNGFTVLRDDVIEGFGTKKTQFTISDANYVNTHSGYTNSGILYDYSYTYISHGGVITGVILNPVFKLFADTDDLLTIKRVTSGPSSDIEIVPNGHDMQIGIPDDGNIDIYGRSYYGGLFNPLSDGSGSIGMFSQRFGTGYFDTVHYYTLTQDSSREVKHDIKALPSVGERLDKLKPVTFVYDNDKEERTRTGLIYEDTIDAMPEICTGDESEKAINYVELIPMLLKEIQDLRARVKILEKERGGI